jgi:tRNA G18 (ribose-2'-O)-methylase SpoU
VSIELIEVDDLEDESLKIYHQMRDNTFDAQNSFVADSPKVVNILLQRDIEIKSILATKEYYDEFSSLVSKKDEIICYVAKKEQMQRLTGHKLHHNCMAHGIRPKESSLEDMSDKMVLLDNITSNQNVGSIARSMAGFGIDSYLLSKRSPHPYGRRALRVSMGYISDLKYMIYEDVISVIRELKKLGYKIYAAEFNEESISIKKLDAHQKCVLILGSEGHGVSQDVLNLCDKVVHVDMAEGVKSFNVSIAAAVMMHELIN